MRAEQQQQQIINIKRIALASAKMCCNEMQLEMRFASAHYAYATWPALIRTPAKRRRKWEMRNERKQMYVYVCIQQWLPSYTYQLMCSWRETAARRNPFSFIFYFFVASENCLKNLIDMALHGSCCCCCCCYYMLHKWKYLYIYIDIYSCMYVTLSTLVIYYIIL